MASSADTFPNQTHKAHYEDQMARSAASGKDVIFMLPPDNPYGDFVTLSGYKWPASAKREWRKNRTVPVKLSDLCKSEKLVTYTFHIPRFQRASDGDVRITKADFERLEATPKATTSLWKMSEDHVALMPKPAIKFTEKQKKAYRDGTIKDENAPTIGDCLSVGYRPQDMLMGADGGPTMPGGGTMNLVTVGELLESLKES